MYATMEWVVKKCAKKWSKNHKIVDITEKKKIEKSEYTVECTLMVSSTLKFTLIKY